MSESEFARMLRLKREEREKKYTDTSDPVHELDTKVSAKRKPLLAAENSPKKKPDAAAIARREKLAKLAQNIRCKDSADRGESPEPERRKRLSNENQPEPVNKSPRKKNSKWAAMIAERETWDSDFEQQSRENLPKQTSAKDMVQGNGFCITNTSITSFYDKIRKPVTAALARAGKSIPEQQSAAEKLSTRRINPIKYREVVSEELPVRGKRFEELDSMDRHDRVANLIKGYNTPTKQPSTPKQENLPAKIRETRLSETSPAKETQPESMECDEPVRLPRPKHLEAQRKSTEKKEAASETPNTRKDREIEEMKAKIAQAQKELEKQKQHQPPESSFSVQEFESGKPNLCSTQITEPNESYISEDDTMEAVEGGFQIEDESTVTEVPNSYQQGHSVTYVQQKFNFLESNLDTSVAELKEERNPEEIRKETNGQFFEAETPEKSKKTKKRRSASFCTRGSSDDMVEFTGKSLQSFRRTQRLKRYEAKATASSVFSNVDSELDLNAERKRLKGIVESEMNIIRQTSAALCVCTDEKHGKGSFTQVDAERLLLVAMKKHEIAKSALAELGKTKNTSISRGRVHVGNFVLKTRYQETFASPQYSNKLYWLMATVQIGNDFHSTHLDLKDQIEDVKETKSVVIPCNYTFENVPADFEMVVTIYSIAVDRSRRDDRKKETGFKLLGSKLSMFNQKANKKESKVNPALMSLGGPNAVRKSNFKPAGVAKIDLKTAQKYDQFKLTNTPWDSIVQSVIASKVEPKFAKSFQFESFITVRSGSGGYGDWIRYWAVLSSDRITFWKYPEDKEDLPAEGHISLRTVVTPKVKAANRTMTKRPNTIELYQTQSKGRKNPNHIEGIVSDYDPNKLVRFLLSADNAESKNDWIKSLNQMLTDLRAWERSLPQPVADILE